MTHEQYIPASMRCPEPITPAGIGELAAALRGRARPAESIEQALAAVEPLARVARAWLDPADPIRAEALEVLPTVSPFARAMWQEALEAMFAPITAEALRRFVQSELETCSAPGRLRPGDAIRFPALVGAVLAGNVPAPAVQAIFCGLLAGSAQLVKTAGEDRFFPVLLARSIAAAAPDLAGRVAVVHWPGESAACNRALADGADAVVAFGRAETLESWRRMVGDGRPLIAHGPRTSLELLELPGDEHTLRTLAAAVARDVAMYDQQGCLSPQQVYLVDSLTVRETAGGPPRAIRFAEVLGDALADYATRWAIPDRELGVKLAIRRARESDRMRRLLDPANGPWVPASLSGPRDRFDWTLLGTAGRSPQVGPGGRTVLMTRVPSLAEAIEAIRPLAPLIQGVALHAEPGRDRLAQRLADELEIPYVCRPGELQRPPFGWRNDNVPPLRSLLK